MPQEDGHDRIFAQLTVKLVTSIIIFRVVYPSINTLRVAYRTGNKAPFCGTVGTVKASTIHDLMWLRPLGLVREFASPLFYPLVPLGGLGAVG